MEKLVGNWSIEPLADYISATLFGTALFLSLLGIIYMVSLPFTWRKRRTIRQITIDFGKTLFWVFVVTTLFDPESWLSLEEYLRIRPLDILYSILVLIGVICMFVGFSLWHPIFMWSPMSYIMHHVKEPEINALNGGEKPSFIEQGEFHPESENAGSVIHLLLTNATTRVPFVIAMVFALPVIVEWEEKVFRSGTQNWIEGITRSVIFGMVHFLMGFVPLGAALSLSLAGVWLTQVYMDQGLDAAVTQHLTYNSIIFMPLALSILLSFFASKAAPRIAPEIQES